MRTYWRLPLRKKEGILQKIPTQNILSSPYQPRSRYDLQEIHDLAVSVKRHGILNPLLVRKVRGGKYEVLAGERRLRVAQHLELEEVPAVILKVGEKDSCILILSERIHHTVLSPVERAEGFDRMLRESGLSVGELAQELGIPASDISESLEYLRLSAGTRQLMEEHQLDGTSMKELLREPKEEKKVLFRLLQGNCPVEKRRRSGGKDVRSVYGNTIQKAVGMINLAGAEADSERVETETCVEYIIRIPK